MRSGSLVGLLVVLAAGCERAPFVVLTVEDPNGMAADFAELLVGASREHLEPVRVARREFPLAITVEREQTGVLSLWVEARGTDRRPLGRGIGRAEFARRGSPSASLVLEVPCDVDDECDDGAFCNGDETCVEGVCIAGMAPCRQSFACLDTTCVEDGGGAGTCSSVVDHSLCPEGTYCNPIAGCVPGRGCVVDADCDDGLFCNGIERCSGLVCEPGVPPELADDDLCTVDGCNESDGVIHVPDASLDGNTCTAVGGVREICVARLGGCVASSCGDGFIDAGETPAEVCDDGAANADGWTLLARCNSTCSAVSSHCGDGVVDASEACDDGNALDDANDCSADCLCAGIACGASSWLGVGGSEFAPIGTVARWGTTASYGVWAPFEGRINEFDAAMAPDGTLYVVSAAEIEWQSAQIFVHAWDGTEWRELYSSAREGISGTSDYSATPVLAIGSDGLPIVAWMTYSGFVSDYVVYVRGYDGSTWQELGNSSAGGAGISAGTAIAELPSMAVDSSGNVIVAWDASYGAQSEIYARRFNGSSWQSMAGSGSDVGLSNTSGASGEVSIVAGPAGAVYAAWSDRTSGVWSIYVRAWNGSAWVELGTGSASGSGVSGGSTPAYAPRLSLDDAGMPVLAWVAAPTGLGRQVYLSRWDGGAWVEWNTGSASGGGVTNDPVGVYQSRLAWRADGNPVLTWTSSNYWGGGPGDLYARQWDGTSWSELGAGSAQTPGLGALTDPSWFGVPLVTAADDVLLPYLGNYDFAFYVMRWDGSAWAELQGTASGEGVSASTARADEPVLLMDETFDLTLLWSDTSSGNAEIYAKRWDGSAWTELGAGSATGGGLSSSTRASRRVEAAFGASGEIVAVWEEAPSGITPAHTYAKRWTGASWIELAGSASGEGVSVGYSAGRTPTVVVDSTGAPVVAFVDAGGGVIVRRFDGEAWVGASGAGSEPPVATDGSSGGLALAMGEEGAPIVAWVSAGGDVCARTWVGGAWIELAPGSATDGCITRTSTRAWRPRLAVDEQGRVVVAFVDEFLGSSEVHVRRLEDGVWSWLDEPTFPYGNASRTSGATEWVSLALDEYGRPVVAFSDATTSSLRSEIFAQRWTGERWVELTPGAGGGGGLSNSVAASLAPSLAVRGRRACVAWAERGHDGPIGEERQQILLRCATW